MRGGRGAGALRYLGAVLVGLTLAACGAEEEPPLDAEEREEVARVYADSVRALTDRADSTCRAERPRLTQHLADSLYELRLADIERQEAILQ